MLRSPQEAGIHIPNLRRAEQALILAAGIGGATLLSGCGPIEAHSLFSPDTPQGHFLVINQDNREPFFVAEPFAARIVLIPPQRPFEEDSTRGKIFVRREPLETSSLEGTVYLSPSEITAQYGVRVAGGQYIGKWGSRELTYKRQKVEVGVWFALSDKQGNFVTPLGAKLSKKEKPYFVAANSVTVIPEENVSQLTYEDIMQTNAKSYYNGTVAISKDVNARREPKLTSEHPTENNAVSWTRILTINGINVKNATTITVQKPLATDQGDNPTHDQSFSHWLIFLAEVKDEQGKIVRIPLYVNASRQTRELVVPDKPWSVNDLIPLNPAKIAPPKDLGTVKK